MPTDKPGNNHQPVLDVYREMAATVRAGIPLRFAEPEAEPDEITDLGGDFPHYIGQRRGVIRRVIRVECDGRRGELPPRFDLCRHSPDGFEWGYAGSGPAQLAIAICADVLDDDRLAVELYQTFKDRIIVPLKHDRWKLTGLVIRKVLDEIREERASL